MLLMNVKPITICQMNGSRFLYTHKKKDRLHKYTSSPNKASVVRKVVKPF